MGTIGVSVPLKSSEKSLSQRRFWAIQITTHLYLDTDTGAKHNSILVVLSNLDNNTEIPMALTSCVLMGTEVNYIRRAK